MSIDFIKIKKKVGKTVDKAKEVSENFIETTKLKIKIAEYKSEIKDKYAEIGKLVYESSQTDEVPAEIDQLCIEIAELNANIDDFNAELSKLNNTKKCPHCDSLVDYKYVYCPVCGNKFE